ncbi:MAG: hypothetical protein Q9213_002437 [Squamulea squamosa]
MSIVSDEPSDRTSGGYHHANSASGQASGFGICKCPTPSFPRSVWHGTDANLCVDDDFGSQQKKAHAMKGLIQADVLTERRARSMHKDQEDQSVEEFLKSDVARNVSWTTHSEFGLLSRVEQAVSLKWLSLHSDSWKRIGQCVDHLIDDVARATQRSNGDSLQKDIEVQCGPRYKDWLHRPLAQQRVAVVAEHRQRWQDKEGAMFRERLEEAYNKLVEDYKLRWENGECYNYHKFLKAQLVDIVRAELSEELRPAVMAELRDNLTPYAQWEDRKDSTSEITRYQNALQFAKSVGVRLRAQNKDGYESADPEQDGHEQTPSLQHVIKASERLTLVLEHGSPEGSESSRDTGTSAYSKGLFGTFPLNPLNFSQHIHHPQQTQSQSSYIPNATSELSSAVRNHGIVGHSIVPPRVQVLKHNAIATEPTVAPSTHFHQPVSVSGAGQSSNTLAADHEAMPPPPRPTGPRLHRHLQPARYDRTSVRTMTEITVTQTLYGADQTLTKPMLPEVYNRIMASTCTHKQMYRDQNELVSGQIGGSRSPTSASWICNEAIEDGFGRSVPADLAPNTDNIRNHIQGQDQCMIVQTMSPGLQTISGLSQNKMKERCRLEDNETDDLDMGSSKSDFQAEAAKAKTKRARLDVAQCGDRTSQNGGPTPYTINRVAAKEGAVMKLKAKLAAKDPVVRTSGRTATVTRAAAAVMNSSTASAPAAGAMIPSVWSPFQASCSGQSKRGRDFSELGQGMDEPRASWPPAKRVRHNPREDSAGAAANPHVAALVSIITGGLSSVAATDTAKEEKLTADKSQTKSEAVRATTREKAEVLFPLPICEKGSAILGSPFDPNTALKRSEDCTEWESGSDD